LRAFEVGGRCHIEVERRRAQSARLTSGAVTTLKDPEPSSWGPATTAWSAACYLARSGLKVLVLERQPFIGGAAVSRRL